VQSTYKDKLDRRSGACHACDRQFTGGETIVSAIFRAEGDEAFSRRDLCAECFEKSEVEPYSVWRGTQPLPVEEKHRVDFDLARRFLSRLIADAEEGREGLVYVLVLLLGRKRRVKVLETRRGPTGERLVVSVPGDEEDAVVEVAAPTITAESAERIQAQLAELFGFAPPPSAEPEAADPPAEA
jgi:hypothetical protein